MRRRITLIINPKSGTLSKKGIDKWVPRHLRRLGFDVTVMLTTGPGHATTIAREAASRGDYAVLACGGDGTVNEVGTGLVGSSTALGILPAGSGNGLARHIGIPCDVRRSLDVIAEDNIIQADYATANGRPFFCTFGLGFDAAVSHRFATRSRRGLNSYILSAIDEFIQYHPDSYEIVSDDGTLITNRAFLVTVCNASQYGNNTFIAPAASIKDGLLDVTIVHDGTFIEKAWSGVEMITGALGNHGKIRTFRTSALTIRRHHGTVSHIDGEPVEMAQEVRVVCHPGKLKILVPRHKMRFVPFLTPAWLTLREWGLVASRLMRSN